MATVTTLAYKDVKTVMTKSSLPVGGYSVNPYVGCPHACRYCYASFMKRFTGHTEKWGTFLDVKNWPRITDPHKYDGEHEATYRRTRMLLEQLRGTSAEIMVTTKSDLVLRDIDLLKTFPKVTVSWSVNTLDEAFKDDMDDAPSIERRLSAMKTFHDSPASRMFRPLSIGQRTRPTSSGWKTSISVASSRAISCGTSPTNTRSLFRYTKKSITKGNATIGRLWRLR